MNGQMMFSKPPSWHVVFFNGTFGYYQFPDFWKIVSPQNPLVRRGFALNVDLKEVSLLARYKSLEKTTAA